MNKTPNAEVSGACTASADFETDIETLIQWLK